MQTSCFRSAGRSPGAARTAAWMAAGALVLGCGGSEFQSSETRPSDASDASDVRDASYGGVSGAGGRGTSGATNGGASSAGGSRNAGGASGRFGSGGATDAGGTSDDAGAGGNGKGTGGAAAGGTPNAGGTAGCSALTTFYPDDDQDSFGRSTGTVKGCAPPTSGNWSAVGGDCDDDAELVFPNEPTYFQAPRPTSSGNHTFDYDCSGVEEGAPGQPGAAPTCGSLPLGIGCAGSGYVVTSRSGPGVNKLCGSTTQLTCKSNGLACAALIADVAAYRCK